MVKGNYQEAEFKNASYKKNKKKSKFARENKEKFFIFLLTYLTYLKKKEGIIFVFFM
jgi:hypothetical protein